MKQKIKTFFENKHTKFAISILEVAFGALIMGIAFSSFYAQQGITPSGFSGLAAIISDLIGVKWLTPAIIYFIINVILFVVTFRYFGWRFALLTVIGIVVYTLAMDYCVIPLGFEGNGDSGSRLLCAVIGGAIQGVGAGITFRAGGSTGGSDFVVLLVNRYFPRIKTGQCMLAINIAVICISFTMYGISLGLYSVIIAYMVSKMTDIVLDGTNAVRAFYIICDKDEEVAERILHTFHRGVTKLNAEGAFSHKQKSMLLCLVTNYQAGAMKSIIKEVDPNSFVFSTSVRESLGEPFFVREASVRKNKILNAEPQAKVSSKYSRRAGKRLSKKNVLKLLHHKKSDQ